ncbi:MAG: amidohydrolase [Clostridia bacterium]|nr:amidohydrolase [Clostridia bacterium]
MLHIINAYLKPITSPDIPCGEMLVEGGKIVAIGENVNAPAGCEVIDAKGGLVCPGFIDAHTHIGLHEEAVRWEGADYNEVSAPVTPEMRAIDAINPRDEAFRVALAGGVTTACTGPGSANVIGGTFTAIKLHGDNVDDMILREAIAMKIAMGENPKGCYGQQGKKTPVTRMAIAALLRGTLAKARKYAADIEAAKADGKPAPFDFQMEAMLPVIRREIPLKAHAHRADDILTVLRVCKEFDVDVTLDHVTEGHLIVDKLAEAGKPVLVGPSFGSKSKFELKEKSFETPGILARAGLDVCIITDAPVIPLNYLPLCAGLAVREGMDEDAAWRAITINPAKVAGIDGRVGSLEEGKDADFVLWQGDPLKDIQARAKMVFVDGKNVL